MEADELLKRIRELEEGQAELKREVARLAPERPSSRDRGGAPPASSSFSRDRPFPALLPPPSRRAIAVHPRASLLLHRQSRAGLSNRHCRRILQSLGQAVHVLSLEGKLLYWNRYAEHLYGYSASEAIGRDCVELLCDPGAFDAANGIIGNVLMGKCWRGNFPVKNKSGERFTILANNTPFYDDDGSLLGLICLSLDVLTLEGIICPSTSPKFYPQSPNIPFQVKVSSRVRSRMKTGQKCDEQYGSGCEDLESEEYDLKEASTLVGDVTPGAFAAVENFPRKLRKSSSADQNEGEDGGCWENNMISRLHDKQENDQSHQGVPILETAIIPDCQDTQYTQDSKYVPSGSWWTFDNNCTTSTVSGSMSSSCSAAERVDYEADCLDYEILWEDLVIGEQVGQGSCGIVYHALWYGSDVAVKVFSKQQYSEDMILTFRQEVSLMKKLRHPNIILFMGAVASLERLCIVTEYLPRGSLLSLLQKSTAKLDPRRRVRMAIDIAKGMNYLHSCSPPVVHRDLKSSNLLVDENWTVKVADFGLSRLKLQTFLSSRTGKGTAQWMAPEVLRNEPSNEKSDVYSYGVVLWELSTQKIPWGDLNPVQVVAAVGFMDRHLEIPSDTDHQWASMIESCWESDPQRRPSFQELLVRLRELQKQCIVQVQTRRKAQKDKVNVKDQ